MTDEPRRILVIKLSSIGDCIHCSAAVRRLRDARPQDYIAWLVEPKSQAVVVGMPFVDEVIVLDRKVENVATPSGFRALRRRLAPYRFDTSIDFQGLGRSGLMALASGARTRVAYLDGREATSIAATVTWPTRSPRQWVVHRYTDLLGALGIGFAETACHVPISEESEARAARFLQESGVEGEPLLSLAIRGSWPSKFWPTERWARVAREAQSRWGMRSIVLGGPGDRPDADRLVASAETPMVDAVGKLSLGASMALVRRSAGLIGPDTGMIYAAMALGTPVVGLFGPTDPEIVGPRGPHCAIVYHPMACGPCMRRPTCRDYDCVLAITVDEVLEALAEVVGKGLPR